MNKENFKREVLENLTENILPYWIEKMADNRGGFYGRRDGYDRLDDKATKGAVLNARILWTFSAAFRVLRKKEYLETAKKAKNFIISKFYDPEFGGIFWSLNSDGTPLDTKKQFYAIGFAIYGLSEYYRATGEEDAKEYALKLYNDIESHSLDKEKGGYLEASTREWLPISDMRLSEKDENASKTMNTHLHILEPYTNLLRIAPENMGVRESVRNLINIFLDKIEDPVTHHLGLFFDNDWNRQDKEISYGHDIEASWLLLEAAQVLGDEGLLAKTLQHTGRIALAAYQGRCADGSMVYERHGNGHYDNDKHWWVQAENVIGQLYQFLYHNKPGMLDKSYQSWQYIRENMVDKENGEWYWSRIGKEINRKEDKAGFWKCPYHNSRMCLEIIEKL